MIERVLSKLLEIGNTDVGKIVRENWDTYQGYHREIDWEATWESVKFIGVVTLLSVWLISGVFALVGIIMMMLAPERTIFRYVLISFLIYVCLNKWGELEIAYNPSDENPETDQFFLTATAVSYLVIFFFAALTSLVLIIKAPCFYMS